jgi:hypothetical protein
MELLMPRTRVLLCIAALVVALISCNFVTRRLQGLNPATPTVKATKPPKPTKQPRVPTATEISQELATPGEPVTATELAPGVPTLEATIPEATVVPGLPVTTTQMVRHPTVTPMATIALPTATPAKPPSYWKTIPIMPGATDGVDKGVTYSYHMQGTNADVKAFYLKNLAGAGWQPFATSATSTPGAASPPPSGNDNLMMIYQKGDQKLTIATVDLGGQVLVVISLM